MLKIIVYLGLRFLSFIISMYKLNLYYILIFKRCRLSCFEFSRTVVDYDVGILCLLMQAFWFCMFKNDCCIFMYLICTCIFKILAGIQHKVQIGMCTHRRLRSAYVSVSSMSALWVAKGPKFLHLRILAFLNAKRLYLLFKYAKMAFITCLDNKHTS